MLMNGLWREIQGVRMVGMLVAALVDASRCGCHLNVDRDRRRERDPGGLRPPDNLAVRKEGVWTLPERLAAAAMRLCCTNRRMGFIA
jgi:hypothetical protein